MEFVHYTNGQDFTNENLNLLLEKEWLNNLIVGNCQDSLNIDIDDDWILASIKNENKTELIMLYRKPWKLLMYSPTNNKSDELYQFVAKEIYKINSCLPGVNTESEIAKKFANYYCEISHQKPKLRIPMRILLLEHLAEPHLRSDVICRKATENDKVVLKQFSKDFHKEALHEEKSDEYLEESFYKNLEKDYYVLEKDGKIVAQTVSTRKLLYGKTISGVYTPKEERKKGYAYNLVYLVSKKFLDDGAKYCVLFTDDSNPISNHIYEKIGYERKVDVSDLDFV
ncbi:MAG: GNAT family N-acetyltransferase [Clostridia bacterium]|nr:GNAT family N-acetyltransferase [Clostridia bacterium]